jgi:hypothetical protein
LGLENVIGPDGRAYIQQSLARQRAHQDPKPPQTLQWIHSEQADVWQISLPSTLPLWLHFDLRQLGDWTHTTGLTCTPLTIAAAIHHGYSLETITWLLETAAQETLTPSQKKQLHHWSQHAHACTLRTVHLLSTAQPGQMAALLRQKRIRSHVIEQLSPRHTIVSRNILPHLEKWLASQQIPLNHQSTDQKEAAPTPSLAIPLTEQTAVQWLGLRILTGLHEITNQPIPSPHALFDQLDVQLDPAAKTELEAVAANILNSLRDACRGRDARFCGGDPDNRYGRRFSAG